MKSDKLRAPQAAHAFFREWYSSWLRRKTTTRSRGTVFRMAPRFFYQVFQGDLRSRCGADRLRRARVADWLSPFAFDLDSHGPLQHLEADNEARAFGLLEDGSPESSQRTADEFD